MRFYAELQDFLPDLSHTAMVTREFDVTGSVKDMVESCGVPHTEVDLIIVNGESVGFDCLVRHGDHISVYPVFESFDISPIVKVRGEPLRETRFVADVHLGRLARYLRLLGFDTLYDNGWDDSELVELSVDEARILLTRDVELLKRGSVTHGYYLRSDHPRKQVVEVAQRFHLDEELHPFTRCTVCNGPVATVEKSDVEHRLRPHTIQNFDEFGECAECQKVYWRGAHRPDLERIVETVKWARTKARDNREL